MPVAILSTHGRVTIPLEIRKGLRLKPHDVLTFTMQPHGAVVIGVKGPVLAPTVVTPPKKR